jgi:hypothetical protein
MPIALTSSNPPEVFISYSHKDEELLERLEVHLNVLKRQNIITLWHGRKIFPGDEWEEEIDKHLNTAQIILLLVSADFIASDYCYGVEFKRAMERNELEAARVIPVILSPSNWRDTPLGKLNALPKGAKPVVKWPNIDDAFVSVIDGIKEAVKTLRPQITSVTDVSVIDGIKETVKTVRPQITSVIEGIEIIVDESGDLDQDDFKRRLRIYVGVDLGKITISVQRGSIKIVIEGDHEELARIVNALRDSECRERLFEAARLKSITYIQDQRKHSLPLEPLAAKTAAASSPGPAEILRQAIRAVPAVKFALGVAGIAAAVTIVAGFSVDYKVAVLGTIIMFGLMFGLVLFSSFASKSTDAIKPLALFLAWTFVILISATSLCIFTSFFFDFPRPLEAYVRPGPTPLPSPLPGPTPQPSPISTAVPSQTPKPEPSPTPTITTQDPALVITEVPPYDPVGGPASEALIAGKVSGIRPEDYCIVIYSLTTTWYVQPTTAEPRTPIGSDGTWRSVIQTGTIYAILLVPKDYQPPPTTSKRPVQMPGVVKWIEIEGKR